MRKSKYLTILIFTGLCMSCKNPFGSDSATDTAFRPGISTPTPMISSVSPSSGGVSGGTVLTITGVNFVSGLSVSVGTQACLSVTFVSSTQVTCTTPAASAGMANVSLTNPDQQIATKVASFEYSSSVAGGTSYAVMAGGGISTGGTIKLQGSAGEKGTPFEQTGAGARNQSGIQGVLREP